MSSNGGNQKKNTQRKWKKSVDGDEDVCSFHYSFLLNYSSSANVLNTLTDDRVVNGEKLRLNFQLHIIYIHSAGLSNQHYCDSSTGIEPNDFIWPGIETEFISEFK